MSQPTLEARASLTASAFCLAVIGDVVDAPELARRIHLTLIEAGNDELERRREVESRLDRAIRLQEALEVRNAQLEGWLKRIRIAIARIDGEPEVVC